MNRTFNVSERVPRVSIGLDCVLESASFTGRQFLTSAIQCAFGLFPKFSTPVEKPVENRGNRSNARVLPRIIAILEEGESVKPHQKALFGGSVNVAAEKWESDAGRKPAEA